MDPAAIKKKLTAYLAIAQVIEAETPSTIDQDVVAAVQKLLGSDALLANFCQLFAKKV